MSDELPTPDTSNRDTNTTSVGGNVTTGRDFVGRDLIVHGDQVEGDKVARDKISAGDRGVAAKQIVGSTLITGDNNTFNYPRLDLTDARNQRNHATMRQLVRKFWIDGVLKSSLYNEVLIRLNLTEQPKAVDNRPWDLILQQPGKPNYDIPPGTPIIDVFDQMSGLLLILGEPGSGKTTTLLDLADTLLKRAEEDLTHPTPVVFNLSSWTEKRLPIAEWLVYELYTKYNIPKKVAQRWVYSNEILPLLDGLDEVKQDQRNACVSAINQFHQEHFISIAVCSRITEYENLENQLKLQGAVLVQPPTLEQIDKYLDALGSKLSTMRIALKQDYKLQDLVTKPLILNIMILAYQESPSILTSGRILRNQSQRLFDTYIYRMFVHRNSTQIYPPLRSLLWLRWLAQRMTEHTQTVFFIEKIQPAWLATQSSITSYALCSRLATICAVPLVGIAIAVVMIYLSSLYQTIPGSEEIKVFDKYIAPFLPATWIINTLVYGLAVGLFDAIKFKNVTAIKRQSWKNFFVIGGFIIVAKLIVNSWGVGLIFGLRSVRRHLNDDIQSISGIQISPEGIRKYSRQGRIIGLGLGMALGGFYNSLFLMTTNGLIGVIIGWVVGALLGGGLKGSRVELPATPNQGIFTSAKVALFACVFVIAILYVIVGIIWLIDKVIVANLISSLDIIFYILTVSITSYGIYALMWYGLIDVIQHVYLRFVLYLNNSAPLNYSQFLDYCHNRIFLRKVGGGYIFVHRMLMEHFASLTDEDIKRIATAIEASRS